MTLQILRLSYQEKTVNRADPTSIMRHTGKEVVKDNITWEEGKEYLARDEFNENLSYEMSCQFTGSSEFVPTKSYELVIYNTETGDIFGLNLSSKYYEEEMDFSRELTEEEMKIAEQAQKDYYEGKFDYKEDDYELTCIGKLSDYYCEEWRM